MTSHHEPSRSEPAPAATSDPQALLDHLASVQAQLDEARSALLHSHRLATLGTLASAIAHEYNNILTPVISYAQLALNRPDDSKLLLKAVERALAGAERAAAISSSILGFARESGDAGQADLRQTVDASLQCLARDPAKDGIEVQIDLPDVRINMSELALQQVLVNLVLNARKAMRRRGGRLTISATSDEHTVRLTVRDTGPGIPAGVMDRLFEPFVTQAADGEAGAAHGDPTRHGDPTGGTGLGLCICKQLIENAGGAIDVHSEPGRGARFTLTIPKARDMAHAA